MVPLVNCSEKHAAAIDMGSNSFRLLIGIPGQRSHVKKTLTVGLGRDLARAHRINPAAITRGLATLAEFRRDIIAAGITPPRIRVCGTEALRQAANGTDFVNRATKTLGSEIEIITGRIEAELTLAGVIARLKPQPRGPVLVADIGANSTEVIFSLQLPAINRLTSLAIGAASVTHDLKDRDLDRVAMKIDTTLTPFWSEINPPGPVTLILSGGSATTCAAMDLGLDDYDPDLVQGHEVRRTDITRTTDRLIKANADELATIRGLDPDRIAIIAGGALLCRQLLYKSGVETAIISDSGLLEGIFMSISKATSVQGP